MENSELITRTAMDLLEELDSSDYKDLTVAYVGIVVISENDETTLCHTRSSTDRYHEKLGMWQWALDKLKRVSE